MSSVLNSVISNARPAASSRARRWAARAAREPLLHFVVAGLILAIAVHFWGAADEHHSIRFGAPERQRIVEKYVQQFGSPPSAVQLEELVQRYIHEEIFVREATALHLDQNDEIVRRRLLQKYEFLQSDLSVLPAPSEEVLQRWFDGHRDRYLTPARVAFSQIFFSPDGGGPELAKARAHEALERLRIGAALHGATQGDAFPGPASGADLTPADVARLFGESEFSARVFDLPPGKWSGPYRSGYGWHLMRIDSQFVSASPPLGAVREQVLADYLDEQRGVMNARAYASLQSKYRVVDQTP